VIRRGLRRLAKIIAALCAGTTAVSLLAAYATGTGALVTKTLIGLNVAVYLVSVAQGSGGLTPSRAFIDRWALNGLAVADGEWYRLITSAFLHASPIHLAFNMLMLWWFGQALEAALGRGRFVGVYLVSALWGSAGALLLSDANVNTVGASGAVFGILGAGLVLERRQIYVFGGGALFVVILNVAFTFAVSNISIGGHLGGLAGGMLAVLALSAAGRHPVYGRFDPISAQISAARAKSPDTYARAASVHRTLK